MLFRTLNYFAFIIFALSATLNAMTQEDLIIASHLPPHKKEMLFHRLVKDSIPGKVVPDNYHITLGIIKNVQSADYRDLQNLMNSISCVYLKDATFTATSAKRYLVNRTAATAPLVLSPKAEEAAKFKVVNGALHQALQEYNTQRGKQYEFYSDSKPDVYEPHITLLNNDYIQNNALDRELILNRINPRIDRINLELLHERVSPQFQKQGSRKHVKQSNRRNRHVKHRSSRRTDRKHVARHHKNVKQRSSRQSHRKYAHRRHKRVQHHRRRR